MKEPKALAEKIEGLPAWAREHIVNLERERGHAVRALSKYLDQKPSAIFTEDMTAHWVGEFLPGGVVQRNYIQNDQIFIEAHGVRLHVTTRYGSTNDKSIVLRWSTPDSLTTDVAMIPLSFQQARLIAKEKMT